MEKAKGEDNVDLLSKVLPVHSHLLTRKSVMQRAFSLTNMHLSNIKTTIILGLNAMYAIYCTVGARTDLNDVQ